MRGDWAKNGLGLDMKLGTEMKHYDQNDKYCYVKKAICGSWLFFCWNDWFMNCQVLSWSQFWSIYSQCFTEPLVQLRTWILLLSIHTKNWATVTAAALWQMNDSDLWSSSRFRSSSSSWAAETRSLQKAYLIIVKKEINTISGTRLRHRRDDWRCETWSES